MKKHTEKQPIDDLFARKLGNMSLPPSSTGFERLQARLGNTRENQKVVFWRNPDNYRYMAAAACLVMVCLFGWFYRSSNDPTKTDSPQVASNKPLGTRGQPQSSLPRISESEKPVVSEESGPRLNRSPESEPTNAERLAQVSPADQLPTNTVKGKKRSQSVNETLEGKHKPADEAMVAQTSTDQTGSKSSREQSAPNTSEPRPQPSSDQQERVAVKAAPAAERVLVVTIAEPEALVAARQAVQTAVEAKSVVATNDKSEKDKSINIWQQVKRFKQGEVFAHGNKEDSESGLLGRAYSGIKHSFEKDKAAKQ